MFRKNSHCAQISPKEFCQKVFPLMGTFFFAENDRSNGPLTFHENRISEKNLVFEKNGKKGKSGWGAVWLIGSKMNVFQHYLDFRSSDFDETLRNCSWYEKNED